MIKNPQPFRKKFQKTVGAIFWTHTVHYMYVDIARRSSARGVKQGLSGKAIFELNASISRKLYEIRPKLLLMTNRKLHMHFRLTPRSMTLDDPELLSFEFS